MPPEDRLRAEFAAAIDGAAAGLATADRICAACVDLLQVEGAALSLMHDGSTFGTFGSSSELSRRLDEFQFTFGEGPCLDAVRQGQPIVVADLQDPAEQRWPTYAGAVLDEGVRAVYALPVSISSAYVGVLDLFRAEPSPLNAADLTGGLFAASLAMAPLRDLISTVMLEPGPIGADVDAWAESATLERVEVYQATGMVMDQLGVTAAEALVRLRAHAFARAMTASELAWQIVRRQYRLDADPDANDRGSGLEGGG
jgi:hypothetical protein